ncbi:hypothetical protein BjapCC829_23695 [Bradyrhizobium barranii]|uniref:DUF4132 domain-containing protein n=1 Tax=Bradyrhizobium barranii TaxID=2992140 RepID=A0ABY3QCG7_9BRAD|nr:hypothetical protein [Bradyrhizobium japonicum]UFW82992.1 hypothetical protein BjapCC829_23695 [Bradyrhizobium japonicum]
MTREFPDPREIHEELADKAALQIDRLAPVAFDAALDELTRYHRFLLNVNAARDQAGNPFNYAAVPGEAWRAPHNQWIGQYRRLFERAASHIGDDPDFMEKLANVPLRLLPGRDDPQMSDEVLQAIVDLGLIMIHQMEAWVARRTVAEAAPGTAASPRMSLAGSDAKSYANLLLNIVGAWESLLQNAPFIFRWRDERQGSADERWNSLRASWPFLWQHLRNTAYMLAVSVWNEDEAGAAIFRDALIRWPQTLSHHFADQPYFLNRRLLFPDILRVDLATAQERIRPIVPEYMPHPSPDELFNVAMRGAHDDVLLLTGALLLYWSMDQKRVSDVGARTALALLRRELEEDPDGRGRPIQENSFRSLAMEVIRLDIAASYGADLDDLVRNLDNMTERRVVPGRVFTPSTLHDRDGLRAALLAMLLSKVSENEEALVKRVQDLAENESALPNGDRSLRDILHGFDRLLKMLEAPQSIVQRGLHLLKPGADDAAASTWVKSAISSCVHIIEAERTKRLQERPIDNQAISKLRDAAERAMMTPPGGVPFFRGYSMERIHEDGGAEVFTFRLNGLTKAQFVNPPMDTGTVGFAEHYAGLVTRSAGDRAWRLFTRRARQSARIASRIEEQDFWEQVKVFARDVGAEPLLIVSRRAQGRALRTLVRRIGEPKIPIAITRKAGGDVGDFYMATIEGIDVHGADFEPGKAWLFSPYLLRSLQYATIGDDDHILRVNFQPGEDGLTGPLVAEFQQQALWADWTMYEIDCEDPDDPAT